MLTTNFHGLMHMWLVGDPYQMIPPPLQWFSMKSRQTIFQGCQINIMTWGIWWILWIVQPRGVVGGRDWNIWKCFYYLSTTDVTMEREDIDPERRFHWLICEMIVSYVGKHKRGLAREYFLFIYLMKLQKQN